jgi:peptidoglycan/xylan/chitin deacetylase (PgdA/CDA1 family)
MLSKKRYQVVAFLLALFVWFYGVWSRAGFSDQVFDLGYCAETVKRIETLSRIDQDRFLAQKPVLTLTELINLCLEDNEFSSRESEILTLVNQTYPKQKLSLHQAKLFFYLTNIKSGNDFFGYRFPLSLLQKITLDPTMLDLVTITVYQKNENRIPILMYHSIDGSKVGIKKQEFIDHLNLLYKAGYTTISLHDYYTNHFSQVPNGRKPIILTFDDGWISQFSFSDYQGTKIDPNCAVGILEDFAKKHPDFGKNAAFNLYLSILPFTLSLSHYKEGHLWKEKVRYLLKNGFEIGCHTYHHQYLGSVSYHKFRKELDQFYQTMAPLADKHIDQLMFFSYPGGIYPQDMRWIRNYTYQNKPLKFSLTAFGGNARIPFSQNPDIHRITRILGENKQVLSVSKQKSFTKNSYSLTLPKMMLSSNELLTYWINQKTNYSTKYLLSDTTIIYSR